MKPKYSVEIVPLYDKFGELKAWDVRLWRGTGIGEELVQSQMRAGLIGAIKQAGDWLAEFA